MSTISLLFVFLFQQPMGDTVPSGQQSVLFMKKKNIPTPSNQLLLIIPPQRKVFSATLKIKFNAKKCLLILA